MGGNRFGGERLESRSMLSRNNLLEHLARYELLPGGRLRVLDVGCGAGHGTNALAQRYRDVVGVDIAPEAIDYAREYWAAPNATFQVASALDLPFPDASFDHVACFEVFEHLEDWRGLLREIRRVLRPGGVLFISTPNKDIYSPGTKKPINPHHVFEMTLDEFRNALLTEFVVENMLGQRTPVYNDHWVWTLVNPMLFCFRALIPYRWNNTLKLKIINKIKPELDAQDIVFRDDPKWVACSRFLVACCRIS